MVAQRITFCLIDISTRVRFARGVEPCKIVVPVWNIWNIWGWTLQKGLIRGHVRRFEGYLSYGRIRTISGKISLHTSEASLLFPMRLWLGFVVVVSWISPWFITENSADFR